MWEIPAFRQAMRDPWTKGQPRELLVWCHEHLDVQEFTSLKVAAIACELHIPESTIARSIHRLVERGYLDPAPNTTRPASYRLYHSRHEDFPIPDWR